MRWLSLALSGLALAGCGGPVDCSHPGAQCSDLPEGKSCRADSQCAGGLICFPVAPNGGLGQCRRSCSPTEACSSGFTCYDPGRGLALGCVPAPGPDETWTLTVESLSVPTLNPRGQPWDGPLSDEPDPFVCFGRPASATLCTTEQHGYSASWSTTPFHTTVTTASLLETSVTVFDGDSLFDFAGCEGSCGLLGGWAKETVYGQAFDLRPQWSAQPQVWVLSEASGLRLELHLDPVR